MMHFQSEEAFGPFSQVMKSPCFFKIENNCTFPHEESKGEEELWTQNVENLDVFFKEIVP